jgi:hypothetical protein
MLLSRHQNAGQNRDLKIANISLKMCHSLSTWEATVTNQNLIQEEITKRLNSGNVC